MKKPELFEAIPFELTGPITEVEHGGERLMQITGIMHRANERTDNNRIYPAVILSREVARLQERLKNGDTVFSQADRPADGVSRISDTAAMLTQVEYTPQDEVIGTAVIVPTQKGKDLAAIVRAGGKVVITVRGFGTTRPGEWQGVKGDVVQEDYQLVTYDFVIGQSLGHYQILDPASPSTGSKLTRKQEKFADALAGEANGNQTLAARLAGYKGDDRQLAVQGSVNMKIPEVRQRYIERLGAMVELSTEAYEGGLKAIKRRAFIIGDEIRYTDPEADHRVRVATANKVLDRYERLSNHHAAGGDADVVPGNEQGAELQKQFTGQAETQGCAEPRKEVAVMDCTDRMLMRETAEADQQIEKLELELTENKDER